jgi:hypothetical protein
VRADATLGEPIVSAINAQGVLVAPVDPEEVIAAAAAMSACIDSVKPEIVAGYARAVNEADVEAVVAFANQRCLAEEAALEAFVDVPQELDLLARRTIRRLRSHVRSGQGLLHDKQNAHGDLPDFIRNAMAEARFYIGFEYVQDEYERWLADPTHPFPTLAAAAGLEDQLAELFEAGLSDANHERVLALCASARNEAEALLCGYVRMLLEARRVWRASAGPVVRGDNETYQSYQQRLLATADVLDRLDIPNPPPGPLRAIADRFREARDEQYRELNDALARPESVEDQLVALLNGPLFEATDAALDGICFRAGGDDQPYCQASRRLLRVRRVVEGLEVPLELQAGESVQAQIDRLRLAAGELTRVRIPLVGSARLAAIRARLQDQRHRRVAQLQDAIRDV